RARPDLARWFSATKSGHEAELTGRDDGRAKRVKGDGMSLYMATFGYKPEVWAGFVAHPENREETVRRVLERVGCKLDGLWYAFGDNVGFALIEGPDTITEAGFACAVTASLNIRAVVTSPMFEHK